MIETLLQILAPHYCCECGQIGTLLCDSCRYDIASEPYSGCIVCRVPAVGGICSEHRQFIDGAWVVGDRSDGLGRLIDKYKFERAKAAYSPLASLLDDVVPLLPGAIVTTIPTVRSHVRARGYDHARLLARSFARRRNDAYQTLLIRQNNTKQRGASYRERIEQAKQAFVGLNVPKDAVVLLIDDVITTGATLHFGAKALKRAGAKTVYVAAVAKQPLDETKKI